MPNPTESKLKTGTLSLGGTQFAIQAKHVSLVPDQSNVGENLEVLSGDILYGGELTTWTLHIEALQDFELTAGLQNYLLTNAGLVVAFIWKPKTGTQVPTYSGTVLVRAPEIGGDVNTRLDHAVDLPLRTGPVTAYA